MSKSDFYPRCPKCGSKNIDIEEASQHKEVTIICLDCEAVTTKKTRMAKEPRRPRI